MERYTVLPGDTMVRIAHKHGFPRWQTIYEHPENAGLRQLRPDSQILYPGDLIFIPDRRPKSLEIESGRMHQFRQKEPLAKLRLIVEDESGRPCATKPYSLTVGPNSIEGMTKEDGLVELDVDPDPPDGKLTVWPDGRPGRTLLFKLLLGGLNPIDTDSGLKARLLNLGFDPGTLDGEVDERTKDALRTFQIVAGLPVTGEADQATKAALVKAHDRK